MRPTFFRRLLQPLCLVGAIVFAVGLGASCVALLADLFLEESRPYQGLLTFVLYPSVMFLGALVLAAGLLRERRRAKKLEAAHAEWRPALDVGKARHRRILFGIFTFGILFVLASILGATRAYEYTESDNFCGALCHVPMEPHHVAHQDSPHANIGCVQCHVAPGLGGYVDAKVSGLRQVYQVLADSYDRPIRVAREKVPAASQTCRECHWEESVSGWKLQNRVRFGYDLRNTRRTLQVLLDVGSKAVGTGIHWHADLANKVWFRATDERRQNIPWVKVERADGTTVVYRDREQEVPDAGLDSLREERMDCLDCHNRVAHRFSIPEVAVDDALRTGALDASLPSIKKVAVTVLAARDEDPEKATAAIRERVERYYAEHFEGTVLARKPTLDRAIEELQRIYRRNVFAAMKVDGDSYPDQSSHRWAPGCFRCHGGKHVSDDGEVLAADCGLCHEFYHRSPEDGSLLRTAADAFSLHPYRHEEHTKVACWTCHAGTASPYAACSECHKEAVGSHGMRFECSICHRPGAPEVKGNACARCHPVGGSPLHAHKDHGECLSCHQAHGWNVDYRKSCAACHEMLGKDSWEAHYPGQACSPCHDFRGVEFHMMGLPVRR